jgi:tRNA-modifying protein YgfZ
MIPAPASTFSLPMGLLRVRGNDASAFLHRMSSQDVAHLAVGDVVWNAFTNDKGRFVDVVRHAMTADGVVLLTGEGRAPVLAAWLDRYLFSEDVQMTDESTALALQFGEEPSSFLCTLEGGYVVAGSGDAGFEAWRIALGLPTAPNEINDGTNPMELDLHDAISWKKGCYIGQEVIARVDTYQKNRRQLVGVVGEDLMAGTRIVADGVDIGVVTSAVAQPYAAGAPSALALVKAPGLALPAAAQAQSRPVTLVRRQAMHTPHD